MLHYEALYTVWKRLFNVFLMNFSKPSTLQIPSSFFFYCLPLWLPYPMSWIYQMEKSHGTSSMFFLEAWVKLYSKINSFHSKLNEVGSRSSVEFGHKMMLKCYLNWVQCYKTYMSSIYLQTFLFALPLKMEGGLPYTQATFTPIKYS